MKLLLAIWQMLTGRRYCHAPRCRCPIVKGIRENCLPMDWRHQPDCLDLETCRCLKP